MQLDQAKRTSQHHQAATLDDRYLLEEGRVFLSGIQALVRLPIDQARRDRRAGLRTGFFVTGYPGSPLGGYDLTLNASRNLTEQFGIVHQPGQNEELAATAVTGTQMLDIYPSSRHDGVVGIWYGKGPGMDRSGDAIRHGNAMGTSRHGAVVMLSGEDHEAKSSTLPIQQEWAFVHAGLPVLGPRVPGVRPARDRPLPLFGLLGGHEAGRAALRRRADVRGAPGPTEDRSPRAGDRRQAIQ